MVQWYLFWSQLKRLDLDYSNMFLSRKQMYSGSQAKKLFKDRESGYGKALMKRVKEAYTACAKVLQNKLPLDNKVLR